MKAFRLATPLVAVAALLTACGGGDEGVVVDEHEPKPTNLSASVTVTAASDVALNGLYSTDSIALNNVTKVNPIGGDPETCRFKFSGLRQQGTQRLMDGGDIRYIPGSSEVRVTFLRINTVEFALHGTAGASVDRPNNRIVYTNAVLTSTAGTGQTITLTGAIPMLGFRPEGC